MVEVSRPDWTSATVTARAQGVRVEVLSERTETRQVWVHPDGLVEEATAFGAVRFEDESAADGWRDIDTTLTKTSEGIVPVAMPVEVELAGEASGELVVFDQGGDDEVGLALEGVTLPEPTLEGNTATYAEVLPGVDVTVEVLTAGFEVLWVVKSAEAAQLLVDTFGVDGQVVLPTKLRSKIAPEAAGDGSVQFQLLGERVGRFGVPTMWDSSVDVPGVRGAETKAGFTLEPQAQARSAGRDRSATAGRGLGVTADEQWLLDEERVFPISIDPTYLMYSVSPVFDTWVQHGVTVDKSTATDLRIGNPGQGQVARSFLNFKVADFRDRKIVRANLSLYQSYASTCAAHPFASYDAGLASTSSRWTAQPTLGMKRVTVSTSAGHSSACPAARVSIDMTAQAQAWSISTATQVGMMLGATDITNANGWKIFHSSEGNNKPVIAVFYNRVPDMPVAPTVVGAVSGTTSEGTKKFTNTATPTITVPVKDSDADTVTAVMSRFTSATATDPVAELCRASAASGSTVSCKSVPSLSANTSIWVRATAYDGYSWSGWGQATEIRYSAVYPPAPTITCTKSPNGSWASTVPTTSETCTIVATPGSASASAPTSVTYKVNGGTATTSTFTQLTANKTITTLTVPAKAGGHSIEATAKSPVGRTATKTYSFGYGGPTLVTPTKTMTTHGTVNVKATGAPQGTGPAVTGNLQWKVQGTTAWKDLDATVTASTSASTLTAAFDTAAIVEDNNLPTRTSVVLEIRAKFLYGTNALYTASRQIVRVPHAFGAGFPVEDVTGGQVALWTGEFQATETDAELTTPGGELSVSRTHSTWAGDSGVAQSVFGPGWIASLDGGPLGVTEMELVDNTMVDGTLVLVDSEGTVLPFAPDGAVVRTTATIPTGTYLPIGADAEASGLILTVASTQVTATDKEGFSTLFKRVTAPTATMEAEYQTDSVTDSVTGEKTSYRYNSAGLVTSIIAPQPEGVTTSCEPGTPTAGCRVLKLGYTTINGAQRLSTIKAQVNTDADRTLSSYTYDSYGRLISQKDEISGLTTSYTWSSTTTVQPKLASITPPGEEKINYTYLADTSGGKLSTVTRTIPAQAGGGTAQLAAIIYNQTPANIPGLNLTQFADYPLTKRATTGFAVFGVDQPITSAPAATDSAKWQRANLWLTDAEGYTIHEASYGAGEWQLTANVYDASDNVTLTWDARATAAIRAADSVYSDPEMAATKNVYNDADVIGRDGTTVLATARTRITDIFTPATMIQAEGAASEEMLRRHISTSYTEAPGTGGFDLETKSVITAERPDGTVVETLSTTWTGYDALETGDKTGWDLRQATSTTTDINDDGTVDAGDIVTKTRYDAQARIIEQRQPGAGSTDPGTRRTVFWSAGTNSVDPACSNQPTWAGYICTEGPASQPAGQTTPVTTYRDYQWHGTTATQIDASGGVARTETTTFDAKTRPVTVTTTVTGLASSTPVPAVTTTYTATGKVAGTRSSAGSTEMTYDTWGRQLTYTIKPAGGVAETTTTEYNSYGEVAKVTTPTSVTVNTYDGPDANGATENRGLLTKTVTTVGSYVTTATAAYDAQGQLVKEKLPGAITRESVYDLAGELISQQYLGQVVIDPETGATEEQPWLAWSMRANAKGQIVQEWNPEGAAFTGAETGFTAVPADTTYTYDGAGRLTQVQDRPVVGGADACTIRSYSFDNRGNRTELTTAVSDTGTDCATTTPTSTSAWTYDAADRPVAASDGTSAYVYDELGRQTSIPAADAPNPAAGNITLGYYDTEEAKTISQGDITLTYGLDVSGRRATQTTTTGAAGQQVVNHYSDDSDNPAWITATGDGTTSTTVYSDLVAGDLSMSIIIDDTGTRGELALVTPRGDVSSTISLNNPDDVADGLDSWTRYTEYGQPQTAQPAATSGTAGNGYGWLGAKQRTTTNAGLLLMGARLYNRATGLFTSIDPIYGGNDTPYAYPNDPINNSDTTGEAGFWRKAGKFLWKHKWDIALTVAGFVPGLGAAAWAVRAVRAAKLLKAAKVTRLLKAVEAGQKNITTTRRIANAAGKRWVGKGATVKRFQPWVSKNKHGKTVTQRFTLRYNKSNGRGYRTATWKSNPHYTGYYVNFTGKGTNVHVRVTRR
ncbi:RHS repeat-associated core domain-containing protein [Tessaracoccus sp. Y36]